jgi:predicted Rossmann-fold nucleotide-binding protein
MEVLTLSQTHKLDKKIPVVLYGSSYWKDVINFEALVHYGTIAPEDRELFHYVDDPQSALTLLQRELVPEPGGPTPTLAKSVIPPQPKTSSASE